MILQETATEAQCMDQMRLPTENTDGEAMLDSNVR